MRLLNISKETSLLNFFKKKRVVTIQDLMEFSQLSLSSVKRRLGSWRTYNSYNYNRSYYVLPEVAKFNSDGIWESHGIYFSQHGSLKQTIVHLANNSESGLTRCELEVLLGITLDKALPDYFKNSFLLNRELENGRYIYFSKEPEVYSEQIQKREEIQRSQAKEKLPRNKNAIVILVELIKHPADTLVQLTRRVRRRRITISIDQARNLLQYHGLFKKSPGYKALQALREHIDQLNMELQPARLFKQPPTICLIPQETVCHQCGKKLTVLKTKQRRNLYTLKIGGFHACITQLCCKQCGVIYSNEELSDIMQAHCRFGFDVLVYAGKELFIECVNETEIKRRLKEKNISISRRKIGELGIKFVVYLSLAHQACEPELKKFMSVGGGYILHLDGTVEGDSPHLMTGMDEITKIVLNNVKIPSENTDDIICFLKEIKKAYGLPAGVVRDMGKGISAAVEAVFPSVSDFICHFHFLRDLGKDLFEYEHSQIRHLLKGHKIKAVLRLAKKELEHFISENYALATMYQQYLQQNKKGIPNEKLSAEIRFYIMLVWVLEYKRELNGLGFPFDRQYLVFYQRIKKASALMESLKKNIVKKSAFSQVFLTLKKIMNDSCLETMAAQLCEKAEVFDQLREAMRIALPQTTKGLNDEGNEDIGAIEKEVTQFRQSKKIIRLAEKNKDYQKMLKQIDKYWDKLFADPIEVETPHGKTSIQPQRTNNIMEQFFREEKRRGRKKSGTSSLSRSFKAMVADTPLVRNLENPQYMGILLKGKQNLEQRFAQIDAQQVREKIKKHEEEWRELPKGIRRMLKMPDLPQKLFQQMEK